MRSGGNGEGGDERERKESDVKRRGERPGPRMACLSFGSLSFLSVASPLRRRYFIAQFNGSERKQNKRDECRNCAQVPKLTPSQPHPAPLSPTVETLRLEVFGSGILNLHSSISSIRGRASLNCTSLPSQARFAAFQVRIRSSLYVLLPSRASPALNPRNTKFLRDPFRKPDPVPRIPPEFATDVADRSAPVVVPIPVVPGPDSEVVKLR